MPTDPEPSQAGPTPPDSSPAALALARASAINQLNQGFLAVATELKELRQPVKEMVSLKRIIYRILIVVLVLGSAVAASAVTSTIYTRRFDKTLSKVADVQVSNTKILASVEDSDKILTDATGPAAQQRAAAATGAAVGQLETITIAAAQCVRDGATDINACVKTKVPSFQG